jgi:hypothetical protein
LQCGYYSDPFIKPNPCLAPLTEAPFYAVKMWPGDLGTKGGLVTAEHARVLRPGGETIPGCTRLATLLLQSWVITILGLARQSVLP